MRKKRANPFGIAPVALSLLCAAAVYAGVRPQAARAIESAATPSPAPFGAGSAYATPHAARGSLPVNSSLFIVLDGTITSRGQSGTTVKAHLRDPIVLDDTTVAPAGTPVDISVVDVRRALMGNVDGWVEVSLKPLRLTDGQTLPLHLPRSHIDRYVSVGQASTQETTDTLGDIFVPYHVLYHALRKGSDIALGPGTVLRAHTSATVAVDKRKAVVLTTPPPLSGSTDAPYAVFSPTPVFTPRGFIPPAPKPTRSPSATPTP